jgi:serine protease AprX
MEPATITINGNVVHHSAQRQGGAHYAPDASHTNYIIIQSYAPLKPPQREELRRLQLVIQQSLAGNTFFCRYNPDDLIELRLLPYLHLVNPYHADYVVDYVLKAGGSKLDNLDDSDSDSKDSATAQATKKPLSQLDLQ